MEGAGGMTDMSSDGGHRSKAMVGIRVERSPAAVTMLAVVVLAEAQTRAYINHVTMSRSGGHAVCTNLKMRELGTNGVPQHIEMRRHFDLHDDVGNVASVYG